MAQNDDAVLVIGAGNYFTAPTGTAIPADLSAPGVTWEAVGHTSLEEVFSLTSEGGEATVLSSLQNRSLRTSRTARQESMSFTIHQFDTEGLKLFYGSNATAGANGEVQVPMNPVPTTCAFLAIYVDGDNLFAIHAPKAEVYRGDDMTGEVDTLAGLPLNVQFLAHNTNTWAYQVTPLGDA